MGSCLISSQKSLEQEKSTKQKALVEFKALPTRLGMYCVLDHGRAYANLLEAQQEEKHATTKANLAGVRQRIEEIAEQQAIKTLARGKAALEYAVSRTGDFDSNAATDHCAIGCSRGSSRGAYRVSQSRGPVHRSIFRSRDRSTPEHLRQ